MEEAMEEQARIGFVREMARKVLRKYGVTQPGTPVEEIAKGEGLKIVYQKWRATVGGLLLMAQKIIGVNSNHPPHRQRFSIGHELGHYFLNHRLDDYEKGIMMDNPPVGDDFSKIQNREADEFANELLVPLPIIKEAYKTVKDAKVLAGMFNVSGEVMFIALEKHKLLK
jgi:Zn-dependent peptidase ImmA (M78 family)